MFSISAQTVGVIVRLEKENFQVLNMHGKVVQVKPQAVQKKKENRRAMALDSDQNTIQVKDILKVIDGPHSGRQGEIKHLFRNSAFLFSKMVLENGGIFVCKTRHLVLPGSNGKTASSATAQALSQGFMSPRLSSPAHSSGNGKVAGRGTSNASASNVRGGFGGRGRGRGRGNHVSRDRGLIGQTIRIVKGPYKGHVGIVKDATEATCRVELHSRSQTIIVDRSRVDVVGAPSKSGYTLLGNRTPSLSSQTPMYGAKTPMYGAQTPQYDGSRTPNYGSMTPLHDGSATPGRASAWDPSITNTPRNSDFEDYSFNDSAPSPAYDPSNSLGYQKRK